MARYSKFHSNYILKRRHTTTVLGNIYERDWVTVGERHQIEKGKKPIYADSNFLFTINSIPNRSRKHNYGSVVAKWSWDDVKDSSPKSNVVKVSDASRDIRDFAYYGSAEELVKASVLDIIDKFPPVISVSDEEIYLKSKTGSYEKLNNYKRILNPFGVNFKNKLSDTAISNYNRFHFILNSFSDYVLDDGNGNETEIESCAVNIEGDKEKVYKVYKEYIIDPKTKVKRYTGALNVSSEKPQGDYDEANCIPEYWYPEEPPTNPIYIQNSNTPIYRVVIKDINGVIIQILAYTHDSEIMLLVPFDAPFKYIRPKKEFYDDFFSNCLDGFEHVLLDLSTNPKYEATLLTPIMREGDLNYTYKYQTYRWPSYEISGLDYPIIDISTDSFVNYVNALSDMAQVYDEQWCDNIYANMTHESIKNFDWTYTRDYEEGDELENIEGGNRMKKFLRWVGRVFDDVKHEIDGIGFTNEITYNGVCNVDDAELTDKLTDKGWFVTSTVPVAWVKIKETDSGQRVADEGDNCVDTTLPTGDVTLDKDTIETDLGEDDGFITNKKYYTYDEGRKIYFTKPDFVGGKQYPSTLWFPTRDYTKLKESDVDINFMKRLFLSAPEIWRSKGTLESIDMVMGLFGFGENDYTVTEEHYYVCPIKATDTLSLITRTEENNTRYSRDGESTEEKTYEEYVNEILDNIGNVYDVSDDLYPGIPLGKIVRGNSTTHENEEYFVPMIEQGKWYDGDVYFQSKGGWGGHEVERKVKNGNTEQTFTSYEYIETLSYLRTAYDIAEMLDADYSSIKEGDFFYVENIADYFDYDENPDGGTSSSSASTEQQEPSHFFKLVDEYQHDRFKGWLNVIRTNYDSDDEYQKDVAAIEHLINIVSTSDGNNPHVGYGDYDEGDTWHDYMTLPFKYAIDNYLITDAELEQAANKIKFNGSGELGPTRKTYDNEPIDVTVGALKNEQTNKAYRFYEQSGSGQTYVVGADSDLKTKNFLGKNPSEQSECPYDDRYYLNSKVVKFTFHVQQESAPTSDSCKDNPTLEDAEVDMKEYFFEKIAPFLLQVIPSTTIIQFVFEPKSNKKGKGGEDTAEVTVSADTENEPVTNTNSER